MDLKLEIQLYNGPFRIKNKSVNFAEITLSVF